MSGLQRARNAYGVSIWSLTTFDTTTSTFPFRVAEVVWGDGKATHVQTFDLQDTHEFEDKTFDWKVKAPNWTWARIAVGDIAGGGAFTNPTWNTR